jgi:hypothetical protein
MVRPQLKNVLFPLTRPTILEVGKVCFFFNDDKDVLGNVKISIFWRNKSKIWNFQRNEKNNNNVMANFQ